MNKLVEPDHEKCTKCNACIEVCPMGVIQKGEDGYPEALSKAFKLCINCGYCVDICNFDALNHKVRKKSSSSKAAFKRYEAARSMQRSKDYGKENK